MLSRMPACACTLTHTLIRLASAQLHLIRLTLWYFLSSDSWSLADCRQGQQRSLVCNPLPFTSCNPLLFSCNFPVHMSDDQRSGTYLHNFLWCDVHMVKTSCVIVWLFFFYYSINNQLVFHWTPQREKFKFYHVESAVQTTRQMVLVRGDGGRSSLL